MVEKKRARVSGVHFTHRTVWAGIDELESFAEKAEYGGWYALLAAQLFIYLALEAYLNYIGALLRPDAWKDERVFFASGEYRGTLGKLDLVLETCKLTYDKGSDPYQSIRELERRRHLIVHPQPERFDKEITYRDPRELGRLDFEFDKLVDEQFLSKARKAVEEVCDAVNEAARPILGDEFVGDKAFIGMTGHQGGELLD